MKKPIVDLCRKTFWVGPSSIRTSFALVRATYRNDGMWIATIHVPCKTGFKVETPHITVNHYGSFLDLQARITREVPVIKCVDFDASPEAVAKAMLEVYGGAAE